MAKFFERLSEELIEFINRQKVFFVATAPPMAEGRINLSPKGMDTLRVLGSDTLAYLDLTGSGNETAAHLRHDPQRRITLMFCSFDEKPLILRLYCTGEVIHTDHSGWADLIAKFPQMPGVRQIILAKIQTGQTSCGFGVPIHQLVRERPTMIEWFDRKGEAAVSAREERAQYRRIGNRTSDVAGRVIRIRFR